MKLGWNTDLKPLVGGESQKLCIESHPFMYIFRPCSFQAIQLEEPFSVLPLANIATGIGKSADEHVQWLDELLKQKGELPSDTLSY